MSDPDQRDPTEQPAAADSGVEPGPPPAAPDQDAGGAKDEQNPEPKRSGGVGFLALLLALAALLLAGWNWWNSGTSSERQAGRVQELAGEVDALEAGVEATLQNELAKLHDSESGRAQSLRNLQNRVADLRRELSALTTADRSDWMLAEVEYLMRLANQRVLMEDDLKSAIVILQEADRVLLELDDTRLHAVRAALAEDLAAARAAGGLDVEGIFLRLAAAARQADDLPLMLPARQLSEAREAGTTEATAGSSPDVEQLMARAWDELRGLVVVRHREDPVRPLLPPDQEYYLRQNLRMLLEQAQLALLRNNNKVYQESLASAAGWVKRYFPAESPAVTSVLDTVQALSSYDVGPRKPDISRSLRALRERQSERHLNTPAGAAAAGDA